MFSIFRDADQLENVEEQLDAMLNRGLQMFDLASDAIFGIQPVEAVQEELWSLDKELNKTERAIRRELMVHGTVRGAEVDQGLMLAYMSVAKDMERIGDYCKNIWDLAHTGVRLGDSSDTAELKKHASEVARLLATGTAAFVSDDLEAVHDLIPSIQDNESQYDKLVHQYVMSDEIGSVAAPRALFFRYLKRISAHLSNVLSSVVMPVDRLDFYKESKAIDAEPD
jgi:phosphate uptake regulator